MPYEEIISDEETLEQDELEVSNEQTEEESSSEEQVPSKFAGKSAEEVADAYGHLESKHGQLTSETQHLRQQNELLQQQMQMLQSQFNQTGQHRAPESDPTDDFARRYEDDPIKATSDLVTQQLQRQAQQLSQKEQQERAEDAQRYYVERLEKETELKELDSDIKLLAMKFGGMVRPEYINSRQMIDALELMAKGKNVSKYQQRAVDTFRKKGDTKRAVKRNASGTVRSNSQGGDLKSLDSMSAAELEAHLVSTGVITAKS